MPLLVVRTPAVRNWHLKLVYILRMTDQGLCGGSCVVIMGFARAASVVEDAADVLWPNLLHLYSRSGDTRALPIIQGSFLDWAKGPD